MLDNYIRIGLGKEAKIIATGGLVETMPLDPPVMTATLPSSFPMTFPFVVSYSAFVPICTNALRSNLKVTRRLSLICTLDYIPAGFPVWGPADFLTLDRTERVKKSYESKVKRLM